MKINIFHSKGKMIGKWMFAYTQPEFTQFVKKPGRISNTRYGMHFLALKLIKVSNNGGILQIDSLLAHQLH